MLIIDIEHYFEIYLEQSKHYENYDKKNDQLTLTIDQLKMIVEMAISKEMKEGDN